MTAVLDANVFVSAAISGGPSHRIVQRWLRGGSFEVVMCPALLAEIDEVLTGRERLRRWIDLGLAEQFAKMVRTLRSKVVDTASASAMDRVTIMAGHSRVHSLITFRIFNVRPSTVVSNW